MFTKCPECQTIQPISASQLRSGKGMVQCRKCHGIFYALEHISETADAIKKEKDADEPLSWNARQVERKSHWTISSVLVLALLIGQLVYFESPRVVQNPSTRLWLENLCRPLHCQLPTYQNINDFSVLQGQLTQLADKTISFQTAISNQAPFAQIYPNLKLTLMDYTGNAFAQRTFSPQEFLAKDTANTLLADASAEVNLKIVEPTKQIGGYSFDLIY